MAFKATALMLLASTPSFALDLQPDSDASIKDTSANIAHGLMSLYKGNQSGSSNVGFFDRPYYWWEGGAAWGAMISYWSYTKDSSYNPTVTQGLLAQTGPSNNYFPPNQTKTIGNDDQAFWALACMDALELGFTSPPDGQPPWLELAVNTWNAMAARWDTETCGGGLRWQVFVFNAGYDYKNTISTGSLFQLSARLARYTGNQTYLDWANKSWDWLSSVGLVGSDYSVYDGTDTTQNCSRIDHVEWTVNNGVLLYGAAVLYNMTNGSSTWQDRAQGLAKKANQFTAKNNATGQSVIFEIACESSTPSNCNTDQIAYKGLLARWLAKSAILVPSIREQSYALLRSSAQAAAASCSGGENKTACGLTWTRQDSAQFSTGVSQQLAALDVVQALLLYNASNPQLLKQGQTASNTTNGTANGATQNITSSPGSTGAAGTLSAGSNWAALTVVICISLLFQRFM